MAFAVRTSVAQSDTSVALLAARPRLGLSVFNDSAADLYLALDDDPAATAAVDNFTVKVPAGAFYESPWSFDGPVYGIWSAGGEGAARVTEVLS